MGATNFKFVDANGNDARTTPTTVSAGAADAGKVVGLNSSGLVDNSMLPTTNVVMLTASENISSGSLVNVYSGGVRNADNSSIAKVADGFAPSTIASGASGAVVLREGMNTSVTGLAAGTQYFLGTVGAYTTTPPSTTGSIIQKVGPAVTSTSQSFLAHAPTVLS